MRKVFLIAAAVVVSQLLGGAAHAQKYKTCSEIYQGCKKTCTNPARGCNNGLCEGFRASCMKTGIWQGTNTRLEGLQKR
jgi:hypothetical protein